MQISEAAPAAAATAAASGETCRFPKLEECAHFHYERVQLPQHLVVSLQTSMDQSLHSHHGQWILLRFFFKLKYMYKIILS